MCERNEDAWGIDMNIVLIGVMGCGKTTIGCLLAKRLKMQFVDVDAEIARTHGVINDIFQNHGEAYFRDIESSMAAAIANEDGQVVSTGGGIVIRPENLATFRKNGAFILFLDRPSELILAHLNVGDRPLIRDNPQQLHAILNKRYPLYLEQADVRIDAAGSKQEVLQAILRAWKSRK